MPSIGVTRPSGQPLAAPSPRLDPNAFGAGIANALQNTAAAIGDYGTSQFDLQSAQAELTKAYKERTNKTNKFKELRGLSELSVAAQERMQELYNTVGPYAQGYTNTVRDELEKQRQEYLKGVSPDNMEEMDYRSGALVDNLTTNAFKIEYKTQQDFFKQELGKAQNDALTAIYDNPDQFDQQVIQVLEQINATDLPAIEKEATAHVFRAAAEAAAAKQLFRISALSQGTIGEADGNDIVAAGLPVMARGLLNAIASVEAPGYDVINGGGKFSDYSQHPGVKGKDSTAAGRYQFVAGTWQRVAQAIHAPTFDPEWQDRGAWWLAQSDFKARTGKDLYTELMSGDRDRIVAVKHVLAGRGSGKGAENVTWEGLQGMSDDKWANYILGSHGQRGGPPEGDLEYPAGPNLFNDPKFSNIPFEAKLALAEDAERQAQQERAAQDKQDTENYNSWLTQFEFDVGEGKRGRADIEAALDQNQFKDFAHVQRLYNIYDARNKGQEDLVYFADKISRPGAAWDLNNTDDKKALNAAIKLDNGQQRLEAGDKDYVEQSVIPLVSTTKMIPTDVVGTVGALTRSNNPDQMMFAYETMRQLDQVAPSAFHAQIGDDLEKSYQLYKAMRDAVPQDELIGRLRSAREYRQENARLAEEADTVLRTNKPDYTAIVDDITSFYPLGDAELPPVPLNRAAFMDDYDAFFREAYTKTADADAAKIYAEEMLKQSWSATSIGGRWVIAKYPPESAKSFYPTVSQSYNWITDQVEKEHPELQNAEWYQLVADPQTRNEIEAVRAGRRGNLPSYLLYQQDAEGKIGPVLGPDNQPVRWRGDPSEYAAEAVQAAGEANIQYHYQKLLEKRANQYNQLSPEDENELSRLHEIIKHKRSELPAFGNVLNQLGKSLRDAD